MCVTVCLQFRMMNLIVMMMMMMKIGVRTLKTAVVTVRTTKELQHRWLWLSLKSMSFSLRLCTLCLFHAHV